LLNCFIVAGISWVHTETKDFQNFISAADEVQKRRIAKNLQKHFLKGLNAALNCAAENGVDPTSVTAFTKELGTLSESYMECLAKDLEPKTDQNLSPDEMKESPVRNKLRRKLEAKRAKARTAEPNTQVKNSDRFR
jgi:hypothetical protein